MRFIDEYRDESRAQRCAKELGRITRHPWTLMEICGGQTHTIVKYGIESLLPPSISLVHGPGCPVCVTPLAMIDKAIAIASIEDVILASFGDMLRVPGSTCDLLSVRAAGGDVRIVTSPLDAVTIARNNPGKRVVFFAVGFETTAPANALSVAEARRMGLRNYSILCSHVRVPPAIEAILSDPDNRVQGILAAGHVCAVMGYEEYLPLAARYRVPIVVTGFEPLDILRGVLMAVRQLEEKRAVVENQYSRAVRRKGNAAAQALMREVFEISDRDWRGIGSIANSGLRLRSAYAAFDAENIFTAVAGIDAREPADCIAGVILRGIKKPHECPAFGSVCTPEHPHGAPMVSSEGVCAAYFHYQHQPAARHEG